VRAGGRLVKEIARRVKPSDKVGEKEVRIDRGLLRASACSVPGKVPEQTEARVEKKRKKKKKKKKKRDHWVAAKALIKVAKSGI
jgi:predicted RNA-binding protein with PIN domain